MNTNSFVKKIGALSLLISINGAEGVSTENMVAINQKIDELANTMHSAMVESGDNEVTYAQIKDSISDHVGVRFMKDAEPSDERPSIVDYLNLQGEDRLRAPHHKHHHKKHHKKHHRKNPVAPHAQPPRQQTFTQAKTQ